MNQNLLFFSILQKQNRTKKSKKELFLLLVTSLFSPWFKSFLNNQLKLIFLKKLFFIILLFSFLSIFTNLNTKKHQIGGDQRDRARAKNQKKEAAKSAGNTEGLSATQRKERDAAIMREKNEKNKKAQEGGGKEEQK